MQQSETAVTSSQPVHEMPAAVTKLKTPENNNTVVVAPFIRVPETPSYPETATGDFNPENPTETMKDNFKVMPEFANTFIGDQNQYETKQAHFEDDYYYRNSPISQNDSDAESRLKIDLSDEEDDCANKRKLTDPDDYPFKCIKKDSPDQDVKSPTFQDNFINSMRISNSSDAEEFSWHPHVYAKPPKVPTPHSIVDILGWKTTPSKPNPEKQLSQLISVRKKDVKCGSFNFAKDTSSGLNFVNCPPLGNMHAGGLVAAREGSVGPEMSEQPLDLCVTRRSSSLSSPTSGLPQDLSKTCKKGESQY